MSKQDKVVEMVKAGQYTRDQIREGAECTSGALASYLSGMRNAAKYSGIALCPVTNDKGIFSVTTFEEAEALKAAAGSKSTASKKSPAKRLEDAKKRQIRCTSILDKAVERAEANDEDRKLELRLTIARANTDLADIELEEAQAAYDATPEDQRGDEELAEAVEGGNTEVVEDAAGAETEVPEDADDFPQEEDDLV